MTELATLDVRIDLDADGDFSASGETVTADVLVDEGYGEIRTERGREQMRSLSPPKAGAADFALNNSADAYGPTSNVKRGRLARIRAAYAGTTYDVFRGPLDYPTHEPGKGFKRTLVSCLGTLSRLIGKEKLSSALYSNITTDVAMGHVLDAAGWPKNLHDYIVADLATNLAYYYDLEQLSGTMTDYSANAQHATLTLGAGTRGAAGIGDGGSSLLYDALVTSLTAAKIANTTDMFDGGGSWFGLLYIQSDGEGDNGRIWENGNLLQVRLEAGGFVALRLQIAFSVTAGIWDTPVSVPINTPLAIGLSYSADSDSNNPTLRIFNLSTGALTTHAVGGTLTETQAPSGTRTTDAASAWFWGNRAAGDRTWDGRYAKPAAWKGRILTEAEFAGLFVRAYERQRVLDVGKTTLDWWWLDQDDAFAEIQALLWSEGPGAVVYESGKGQFVFKNRHARYTEARSTASQATYGSSGIFIEQPLAYEDGIKDVINICEIETKTRSAKSLAVVWSLGATVTLAAGETQKYIARNADPFTAALTPVDATDYTVAAGSLTAVSLDRTSGASCTISLTAGPAGAVISGLQLRAQLVSVDNQTRIINSIDTTASQNEHGKRPFVIPVRAEITTEVAKNFCDAVVGQYQDGRPIVRFVAAAGQSATAMTSALALEISDRITADEPTVPLSAVAFHVEEIRQEIRYGGGLIRTTFGCEKVQASQNYAVWGTARWGTERWGY